MSDQARINKLNTAVYGLAVAVRHALREASKTDHKLAEQMQIALSSAADVPLNLHILTKCPICGAEYDGINAVLRDIEQGACVHGYWTCAHTASLCSGG